MMARSVKDYANWSGYMVPENVQDIADRIEELLADKRYTAVQVCEAVGSVPDVYTSILFRKGVEFIVEGGWTWLHLHDTSPWAWSWCSSHATLTDALSGGETDHRNVRISFTSDSVMIESYAPAGGKNTHVFKVEDHHG